LATVGRLDASILPANFWKADLLPGDQAARRADLVVTNGGSGSSYQALAEGKPVIGIASNLDQHLAMTSVVRAAAGRMLRAENVTADEVRAAVSDLLASPSHTAAACRVAEQLAKWDAATRFVMLVDEFARARRMRASA
jgi:UDP:flavonoid glycosyltransferase YjiC (YdhE family)